MHAPTRHSKALGMGLLALAGVFLAYALAGLLSIAPVYLPPALILVAATMADRPERGDAQLQANPATPAG